MAEVITRMLETVPEVYRMEIERLPAPDPDPRMRVSFFKELPARCAVRKWSGREDLNLRLGSRAAELLLNRQKAERIALTDAIHEALKIEREDADELFTALGALIMDGVRHVPGREKKKPSLDGARLERAELLGESSDARVAALGKELRELRAEVRANADGAITSLDGLAARAETQARTLATIESYARDNVRALSRAIEALAIRVEKVEAYFDEPPSTEPGAPDVEPLDTDGLERMDDVELDLPPDDSSARRTMDKKTASTGAAKE